MKKIILSIALILSTGFAVAEDQTPHEFCTVYSEMAQMTMKARQTGLPVSKALSIMKNDLEKNLVMQAYKKTRWHSESSIKRAIEDFTNESYMTCIEAKTK